MSSHLKGSEYPPEFELFWQEYPRRMVKMKAFESWRKAMEKTTFDVILNAVKAQKQAQLSGDKKFIPHAATWLNQERWNDDVEHRGGSSPEDIKQSIEGL